MVVTTYGKTQIALRIGSNIDSPVAFGIGTGSTASTTSDLVLVNEADKQVFSLVNLSGVRTLTFQGDWNSVEMSGNTLSEFGLAGSLTGTTGSIWTKNTFAGIVFDGINELRIESSIEVF